MVVVVAVVVAPTVVDIVSDAAIVVEAEKKKVSILSFTLSMLLGAYISHVCIWMTNFSHAVISTFLICNFDMNLLYLVFELR